jgi:hypothetical protein
MTTLQLGLIAAGVVFVAAVALYNWFTLRRAKKHIDGAFAPAKDALLEPESARQGGRVEPTLRGDDADGEPPTAAPGRELPPNLRRDLAPPPDDDFEPPIEIIRRGVSTDVDAAEASSAAPSARPGGAPPAASGSGRGTNAPDPDIESIVMLQPVTPVGAGALAAGLHARIGKPLRWFGRRGSEASWQRLQSDTPGEFAEVAACLLLADRNGAASRPLLDSFVKLAADIAPTLPAAFVAPDTAVDAERAEALDRICADLDVQIGLTVLKNSPTTIAGTRLRGVAEAAGFRLTDQGRFDLVQDETGAVLFSLQNYRSEPFTAESLRAASTPGAVFVLDVPRVPDPARSFDQMKLVARRMAQTLDCVLVDDNRRPLDDAALALIRQQVDAAATALRSVNIEPGSSRALALFGA